MKWSREKLGLPYDGGWLPLKIAAEEIAAKWGVEVSIKDKLGQLNIYWNVKSRKPFPAILNTIGMTVESASSCICQYCGSRSHVKSSSGAWIYTLCIEFLEIEETQEGSDRDEKILAALERLKKRLAFHQIPFEELKTIRKSDFFKTDLIV